MRIKKINIGSFGKFENTEYEFCDGINIIKGKNEAGKSTVCSFIKYMLYGFTSGRSSSVADNDKKKYSPWNGKTPYGSATVEAGGNEYIIERSGVSRKAAQKIYEKNTGRQIEAGIFAGEMIFGVDGDTYSKTAYVGQFNVAADGMSGMDGAIRNIVSYADEEIDADKAEKKLCDFRKVLYSEARKTGKIFESEERLKKLSEDFESASEIQKEKLLSESKLKEVSKKIEQNNEKLAALQNELENIHAYLAVKKLENIDKAREKFEQAEEKLLKSEKKLVFGETRVCEKDIYYIKELEEKHINAKNNFLNANRALEDCKKEFDAVSSGNKCLEKFGKIRGFDSAERKKETDRKKSFRNIFFALSALSFAALAVFAYAGMPAFAAGTGFAGIVFLIFAILNAVKFKNIAKRYGFKNIKDFYNCLEEYPSENEKLTNARMRLDFSKNEAARSKEIFDKSTKDLSECIEKYTDKDISPKELCSAIGESIDEYSGVKTEFESARSAYDALTGALDSGELLKKAEKFKDTPKREESLVSRDIRYFIQANELLSEKERELQIKVRVCSAGEKDIFEIDSEREKEKELLLELKTKKDGLDIAIEAIRSACDDIKNSVSPQLTEKSGELFSEISGGKYRELMISPSMELKALEKNDSVYRDIGYLSAGARDAAYLSLRIALADFLYKEKPALIFDESFVFVDDERLSNIFNILKKLSRDYQIFIFTCHAREERFADENMRIIEI